jgi:hypothetical protein
VNEKLEDKQRHFIGRSYEEVGVVLRLGKVMRGRPKPDAYKTDFVFPVKRVNSFSITIRLPQE